MCKEKNLDIFFWNTSDFVTPAPPPLCSEGPSNCLTIGLRFFSDTCKSHLIFVLCKIIFLSITAFVVILDNSVCSTNYYVFEISFSLLLQLSCIEVKEKKNCCWISLVSSTAFLDPHVKLPGHSAFGSSPQKVKVSM